MMLEALKSATEAPAPRRSAALLVALCVGAAWLYTMIFAAQSAYEIRLHAIKTFGYVIHEFDPWFNYRATVYLAENGYKAFFHWFDRLAWYPLGRPVGTTIYPGMQMTSVFIWQALGKLREMGLLGWYAHAREAAVSLNDVCCLVPAWFGSSATVFCGLLTYEISNSYAASAVSAVVMSTVPAHMMRSVGGGYDNESIAMTAMCATFYLWCRALRAPKGTESSGAAGLETYLFGTLAGLAYAYMVAAWGGFTFVVNVVGCHAFVLAVMGRYTAKLRAAYSLFWAIGTAGACMVPVVGWRPLKDMELLPPFMVFVGLQVQARAMRIVEEKKQGPLMGLMTLAAHGVALLAALGAVGAFLYPKGYFGPPSSRVRGLFVEHTRTGNPLVDSVAEHQPASKQAYSQYLHHAYDLVPWGLGLSLLGASDATSILWVYFSIAYFFSMKMARLVILCGPIASACCGVALGAAVDHLVVFPTYALAAKFAPAEEDNAAAAPPAKKGASKKAAASSEPAPAKAVRAAAAAYRHPVACLLKMAVFCYYAKTVAYPKYLQFVDYCEELAEGLSQPSIMFKARLRSGQEIVVDDYREAYWWLRDNTPKDARILAWWDYGYQITGIGERTTLADGNTWNHEHIATIGYMLTAPEKEAHNLARHLADYVLIWAGGGGDDLAKSPHMARISNSIYHHFCPDDPTCQHFGFYQNGQPTESMANSLLYKLATYDPRQPRTLNSSRWEPVMTSKYGKVRIYKIKRVSKDSKRWIQNATNLACENPSKKWGAAYDGSADWYCPGSYPPAVQWLIKKRKPFRQLEDFNSGPRDAESEAYRRPSGTRRDEVRLG